MWVSRICLYISGVKPSVTLHSELVRSSRHDPAAWNISSTDWSLYSSASSERELTSNALVTPRWSISWTSAAVSSTSMSISCMYDGADVFARSNAHVCTTAHAWCQLWYGLSR